jgi:putative ABC transport system ATP-binding protein
MVALVGPSGCGKTTLISILAGLLSRDGGELRLAGTDPDALDNNARTLWRREHVGFIFQQFNLVPQISVLENVAIPLLLRGEPRGTSLDHAAQLLDRVGLRGREWSQPSKLSGGQQQRVAIARSLVHGPSILVCDEPTSALDGTTGQRVMELVREQGCRPDRLVVLVTHDERIFHFADRIVHMDDGRVTRVVDAKSEVAALRAAQAMENPR